MHAGTGQTAAGREIRGRPGNLYGWVSNGVEFLCVLCGVFANFAVKVFKILNRKGRKDSAKDAKVKLMNIGLLGGTFDPIHHGHMALARAAKERFELGRIHFVPANVPPHKQSRAVTPYFHRYAMVVLATMGEKAFVPSVFEAPGVGAAPSGQRPGGKEGRARRELQY